MTARMVPAAIAALATAALLALTPVNAGAATGGDLCLLGSDVTTDTGEPMMAGTNPAIIRFGSLAEVAYQNPAQQLNLYADGARMNTNTGYLMDPRSSPAIVATDAATPYSLAISSNTDELWTTSGPGITMAATGQYVAPGTSPAAALVGFNPAFAYINDQHDLASNASGSWVAYDFGASPASSPSLAGTDTHDWVASIDANTNRMWYLLNGSTPFDSGQRMPPGHTPATVGLGNGDAEIAFEGPADKLTIDGVDGTGNTGAAMAPYTNPAIAYRQSTGTDAIAFNGANGDLWIYANGDAIDTGHAIAPASSPAIAATGVGYEVAYQCGSGGATSTTPSGGRGGSGRGHHHLRRMTARFSIAMTWSGHSSHIRYVKLLKRLPRHAVVSFRCQAARSHRCPRLGRVPRRHRTLSRELRAASGRTFAAGDVLVITVSARGYRSEHIRMRLPGNGAPHYTLSWK